jgi:hypothetical protein
MQQIHRGPTDGRRQSPYSHVHPVIVWIHGGGFIYAQSNAYEPDPLVAQNIVVVTLNYRLGALGLLAHPALTAESTGSGNYALIPDAGTKNESSGWLLAFNSSRGLRRHTIWRPYRWDSIYFPSPGPSEHRNNS